MTTKRTYSQAFTIIELLVAIAVIGILASITIVSYRAIRTNAIDVSIQSDLDALDGIQTNYGLNNNVAGKSWYSATGIDASLNFTPSPGNVIDVVVNSTDYCIRAYNPSGSKKTINDAFTLESSPGSCAVIVASAQAQADSAGGFTGWAQLAMTSSGASSCAISLTSKVYCWGYNIVTDSSVGTTQIPTLVTAPSSGVLAGKTITSIGIGGSTKCVTTNESLVYCWGENNSGQLGVNSTVNNTSAAAVSTAGVLSGKTVTALSSSDYRSCVIASSQVYCWGQNNEGQNGDNRTSADLVPYAMVTTGVLSGKTIKSVSAGIFHTCVVSSDDQGYCAGLDFYGEMGDGTTNQHHTTPVAVTTSGVLSGKTLKSIAAGRYHTCAVASDNQTYCWGRNNNGQLGNNSTTNSAVPVAVNTAGALSGKTITSISVGVDHTCVIASDDKAYCWGQNTSGQLGNSSTTNSSVPVAVNTAGVLTGKSLTSIVAGGGDTDSTNFTCAIASDAKAYCWGSNGFGQLGNNSTTNSTVPVLVSNPS